MAKSKRKKPQKTRYERERSRIMSYVRSLRKKQREIDLESIPTLKQLRKQGVTGSELTKLTNKLKKLTASTLKAMSHEKLVYTESDFYDWAEPEIDYSGDEPEIDYWDEEPTIQERAMVQMYYKQLETAPNSSNYNLLRNFMDTLVDEFGTRRCASAIDSAFNKGEKLTYDVMYNPKLAERFMDTIFTSLPDVGEFTRELFERRMDYAKRTGSFEDVEEY